MLAEKISIIHDRIVNHLRSKSGGVGPFFAVMGPLEG